MGIHGVAGTNKLTELSVLPRFFSCLLRYFKMSRFNRSVSRSTMKVIGGSSHPELTELIARKVGVKSCKVVLGKFANNETNVQLMDQVRCQDVYIIQTGAVNSNDAVMELLLIINSCRLASAESITVITPYYPYSKGDQKSSLRSPITAKLLANMIKKAGGHHLMMLDAHSPQLEGFFDHPVDCLKVEPLSVVGSPTTSLTGGTVSWSPLTRAAPRG